MADLTKDINETIGVSDGIYFDVGAFYSSTIGIVEEDSKDYGLNQAVDLSVTPALMRNANAALYDIMVRNDEVNQDTFRLMANTPEVGYTPFATFHAGDYEYQYGYAGIQVTGEVTEGRAGVVGLQLNVDVPDVSDRGEATLTAGDNTLEFNRTFTVVPEVSVVFKSGATLAIPKIVGSVTKTGFTVKLVDSSDQTTEVAGDIGWTAVGY